MGYRFLDQYSLLHFAMGVVAYFLGIKLPIWIILNIIYEIIENTPSGIKLINKLSWFWPGGKKHPDSIINIIGDILSAVIGWYIAYQLDNIGKKYHWYKKNI